jgi:pyruvate dehydrogenase E2 component (dihydrolipoamide acetyltransferase)
VDFAKFGPIERKELGRIKKISGANLLRNAIMIPAVTNHDDADITDLEAFRVSTNKENEKSGVKVTMLAFLIKASVAALKKFPEFNSSLDGDALVYKQYYHIGFAADTPNGLVVPVIKDADKKGVLQISQEMGELAKKARDGKLGPADMSGATFTISSLGGIGGRYFTPIINAPEVAILGVCKSQMEPVWDGKQFVPRLMLPLSLTWDHRVIDGAAAARFNAYLGQILATSVACCCKGTGTWHSWTSRFPTSATSTRSRSSNCWSSPATPSRPSRASSPSSPTRPRWRFPRRTPAW